MSTNWIKAIALADVPEEDVIAVQAGDREIALYGVEGGVYATDKQVRIDDDGASVNDDEVRTRLADSVERLAEQVRPRGVVVNEAFDLGRLALAGGFSV